MLKPVYSGGIYYVTDSLLRLLPEEKRLVHDTRRPVVVLTGADSNTDPAWPIVLICPISSATGHKTKYDIQLSAGQGGVTKKCWVRVPAVQALMKDKLGDQLGTLDARVLAQVHMRVVQYMGVA